jgi:hypothetical protein
VEKLQLSSTKKGKNNQITGKEYVYSLYGQERNATDTRCSPWPDCQFKFTGKIINSLISKVIIMFITLE